MGGSDITQIALTLGGVYLLLRYGLPEIWDKINPFPPISTAPPPPNVTLSKNVVHPGETFTVSVIGLKPHTDVYYGWAKANNLDIIFEKKLAMFNILGVILKWDISEQVKTDTPPGEYIIYFDQSPFGGYYVTARLTVI